MHASAVLAIAVSALGCALLSAQRRPLARRNSTVPRSADASAEHAARTAPPRPDAWWHREIAKREARIEALRRRVEMAAERKDEQPEDVKARLERELELEEESLDEFRRSSTQRYSGKMMGGGVSLIAVGGGAVLAGMIGAVLAVLGRGPESSHQEFRHDSTVAALVLLPFGISCFAVGLPLFVVGRKKVVKPGPTARLWVRPRELGVRGSF
jgi:hypothetical protein